MSDAPVKAAEVDAPKQPIKDNDGNKAPAPVVAPADAQPEVKHV